MGAVVDPLASGCDPFAGGDDGGVADSRDKISMAACLDPQYAEAVLGVVESDAFDQAGENFMIRRRRWGEGSWRRQPQPPGVRFRRRWSTRPTCSVGDPAIVSSTSRPETALLVLIDPSARTAA